MILSNIVKALEAKWPPRLAEEWDAPGLVCGELNQDIKRVLFTVDVTHAVLHEAISNRVDLIVAHHPFLLRGVKLMSTATAKGSVLNAAIKNDIAIFAAHTNADNAVDGVSATLADALGLVGQKPLVEIEPGLGAGRIGDLVDPMPLGNLARSLAQVIPATSTGIRVAGEYNTFVRSVAVCGGAGDAFIERAYELGADVYVTADLRHHPVQEIQERAIAEGRNFALIDVSHWASEWVWLEVAAAALKQQFDELSVSVSDTRTDSWAFVATK